MHIDSHLVFIGAANHIEIEIDATFIDHCQSFQKGDFTWGKKAETEWWEKKRQNRSSQEFLGQAAWAKERPTVTTSKH